MSGGSGVAMDAPQQHAVGRTVVAMGTTVTIAVGGGRRDDECVPAIEEALGWFRAVEARCTRFDPSSELQQLCSQPGSWVSVSPMLMHALRFALDVAERTDGVFDPCLGHALHRVGYNRHHATGDAAPVANSTGTWRDVTCDATTSRVLLGRPVQLDLGAVAKGMAIDLATRVLSPLGDYAIDAGGDVFAAGRNARGTGWSVGIRDPFAPATLATAISLDGRAVCTTATYERGAHLLDGRTQHAATGLASVSVLAPTAMAADAASTAAFALGPTAGLAFLEAEGLAAFVIDGHGTRTIVGAWPR